jgi:soluble lytic murein transglycosylase-like protein
MTRTLKPPPLFTIVIATIGSVLFSTVPPVFAEIRGFMDTQGRWHFPELKAFKKYRFTVSASSIEEYETIIEKASGMYGVDSPLIKAVIKAESDFNHTAVSPKGAQGLMQLMPSTADTLKVGNAFDPVENILGGTRYLKALLSRFDNDKNLALAAYNAGPEKVDTYRGMPPYPETRSFVKRVLNYYQMYSAER